MREINAMLATVISAYYYHYLLNSIVVIIATVFAQFVLRFELKGNDVSFQTYSINDGEISFSFLNSHYTEKIQPQLAKKVSMLVRQSLLLDPICVCRYVVGCCHGVQSASRLRSVGYFMVTDGRASLKQEGKRTL